MYFIQKLIVFSVKENIFCRIFIPSTQNRFLLNQYFNIVSGLKPSKDGKPKATWDICDINPEEKENYIFDVTSQLI